MVNGALGPGWTRRAATCRTQGLASSIQLLQQGRDAQNGQATLRLWAPSASQKREQQSRQSLNPEVAD
jgi:2,4-dienoyl-CoA reductase-like NADH-dependent reductase (Old Yellow Enzyme family)